MTTAIAYVRVSTQEQAAGGVSLDAQADALRAYAAMRGLELVEVVVDAGVSAGKPLARRPGGRRVLEAVERHGVEAVIAYKLDRLFRDCLDCLGVVRGWDAAGVALHLVDMGGQTIDTSTAMGRFFLTVMAGAAELERNLVAERTSASLRYLQAQGVKLGGEALGWRRTGERDVDGRLEVVEQPGELATVERIKSLRAGGLTLRAIGAQLTADGVATKRGGAWHASTVRAVLARAS